MPEMDSPARTGIILTMDGLDAVISALKAMGYRVIGPRLADDAIIYDDIDGVPHLPIGWTDEQSGGHYRLKKRDDGAVFGYTVAPQGWKRVLYPPRQRLFAARRSATGFELEPPAAPEPPLAFIGVRACELAAMAIQAKVFGDRDFADPGYQSRYNSAFVVAVQCGDAGGTCFCASMGTGPEITSGYDIRLVELPGQIFVADAASERGTQLLAGLNATVASSDQLAAGAAAAANARQHMGRVMETETAARLKTMPEHGRWDQVAARCLTCGNCTMVCPTCFCTTVEDVTDLTGDHAERWRQWDSCFSVEFSYIHGGAVRTEAKSRYRQWITHKLSTWGDQFGSSGCVGCGRCITWCPVGIDITEE
ncbi:MAG: 4Fe-4S dicluster domain-containing protein, partial [Magnetospirillum sp.]|nr:4Fe-4S dicluster domain-containing protein [Magnetospirillum sp.]